MNIKDTYEPTVFTKYTSTLSGFYATTVSEASVAYSCRKQEGPNLKDPSELASLSLDYFIPTNHQMRSPILPHVRHTSFPDNVYSVKSRTTFWNLRNPSRWMALTIGWMRSDSSTIRTFNND